MDRFSERGPNEKYPLPFEDNTIYCNCGEVAIFRHEEAGEMCGSCVKEVVKEYNLDAGELERI